MARTSPVVPIAIGPGNALAVTGWPWRHVRDYATALGVRFIGAGRKRAIPAAAFFEAIERTSGKTPAADPVTAILRQLGKIDVGE